MLLIAIRLGLFLHLFFHVGKHLKELDFVSIRWLNIGSYLLRRGVGILGCMWLIVDWWKEHAPSCADGLVLESCAVDSLLYWGHR